MFNKNCLLFSTSVCREQWPTGVQKACKVFQCIENDRKFSEECLPHYRATSVAAITLRASLIALKSECMIRMD